MYKLSEIAAQLDVSPVIANDTDPLITSVTCDSRKVTVGCLFVAISGAQSDGHSFVKKAFEQGAAACLVEKADVLQGNSGIVVSQSRRAWSRIAAFWHNYPARKMLVIGVTGTSGKTTIQNLLGQALKLLGRPSVRFGTLGTFIGDNIVSESLTTPDAWEMQSILDKAAKQGIATCILEASSHGLEQERVSDLYFDVGVFTNLTRDHLDYHPDMDHYYLAKRRLFDLVASSGKPIKTAVVNKDDSYGSQLAAYCIEKKLNLLDFGRRDCAITLTSLDLLAHGSRLTINYQGQSIAIESELVGEHNAYNLMATFGALIAAGFELDQIVSCLNQLKPVCGRLEQVGQQSLSVYVDYSHKPDALRKALLALRPICRGQLWLVFGCGGDRDRGKRPEMGAIASQLADQVVVTSDNPRTEDPQAIIEEILGGVTNPRHVNPDRKQAIYFALSEAAKDDVILIAGKGHEDYQIIGTNKLHFSDHEVVREFFEKTIVRS